MRERMLKSLWRSRYTKRLTKTYPNNYWKKIRECKPIKECFVTVRVLEQKLNWLGMSYGTPSGVSLVKCVIEGVTGVWLTDETLSLTRKCLLLWLRISLSPWVRSRGVTLHRLVSKPRLDEGPSENRCCDKMDGE